MSSQKLKDVIVLDSLEAHWGWLRRDTPTEELWSSVLPYGKVVAVTEDALQVNVTCCLLVGKLKRKDRNKILKGLAEGKISVQVRSPYKNDPEQIPKTLREAEGKGKGKL